MYIETYVIISENHINICTFMYISIYIHTLHMQAYLHVYIHVCVVATDYISVYIQVHVVFM